MSKNIGDTIRSLRVKNHLTVEELANRVGKSRATMYRYENGDIENVPYTILVPIANALGVDPTVLLNVDKNTENENAPYMVNEGNSKSTIRFMNQFRDTEFSEDEMTELINFANYLISRRGANNDQ